MVQTPLMFFEPIKSQTWDLVLVTGGPLEAIFVKTFFILCTSIEILQENYCCRLNHFTVFVCISVLMLFWHWLFILSPLLFSETLPFILISSVLRSVTEFRHCLATDSPLSLVGSSKSVWIALFLPKGLLRSLISTFFTDYFNGSKSFKWPCH